MSDKSFESRARRSGHPLWVSLQISARGLNASVGETSCIGFIKAQFFADTAIDDITVQVSEGAASEKGEASTKDKDVVNPDGVMEVVIQ